MILRILKRFKSKTAQNKHFWEISLAKTKVNEVNESNSLHYCLSSPQNRNFVPRRFEPGSRDGLVLRAGFLALLGREVFQVFRLRKFLL